MHAQQERRGPVPRVGDYIVAFAVGRGTPASSPPPAIALGDYEGHIVLDRTRLPIDVHLTGSGSSASLTFETSNPHVEGRGMARMSGDSFTSAVIWTFPAQHCEGTMQMRGAAANGGATIVGELGIHGRM